VQTLNKTQTFSYSSAFSGVTLDSALAMPFSPSVSSVRDQIQQEFLPGLGKKPASVPWTAADTVFVISWAIAFCLVYTVLFIYISSDGINDVNQVGGIH